MIYKYSKNYNNVLNFSNLINHHGFLIYEWNSVDFYNLVHYNLADDGDVFLTIFDTCRKVFDNYKVRHHVNFLDIEQNYYRIGIMHHTVYYIYRYSGNWFLINLITYLDNSSAYDVKML